MRKNGCLFKIEAYNGFMRKFIAWIMIIAFITSIFDILDANELYFDDGVQIFTTDNPDADNEYDGLDDDGFQYTTINLFFLPEYEQITDVKRVLIPRLMLGALWPFYAGYLAPDTYHPPIV